MRKAVKNILIVNPFGIGDVLFTTPLVDSLKAGIESSMLGFLCNRRTEPLLKADPKIEWVFVYEKDELKALWKESKIGYFKRLLSLIGDIRQKGFDIAIDLSLNREYGFLCMLAGIKERVGFNYKKRGVYLTKKIDICGYHDKHIIEYYLGLLKFVGVLPVRKEIRLSLPREEREWALGFIRTNGVKEGESLIGIAPAGGASWGKEAPIKHWRAEGFADVADRLAEKTGARVIILGSASEAVTCEEIAGAMRKPSVMACGKATLLQSAALMSLCELVLANDGGPLHMAAAVGTRTVGIFGPVDERVYGHYPPSVRHRAVKEDLICRPCYRNFKMKECEERACLDGVSADKVFKAAEEVLAER